MPVHVFGNPCDVESIQKIADKHGLKVIYDAAHAIGSTYNGRSILEYGDISATSLHATKLLNTAEGGGCVTRKAELHERLKRIRFFGHDDVKDIIEEGFNGKMTEIHAALGLANLKYFDDVLADRRHKYNLYKNGLEKTPQLQFQQIAVGESNYSYFPIIFNCEKQLLQTVDVLNANNIFPRRYFFPTVNQFSHIVEYTPCPVAENITQRILCLPLYWKLNVQNVSNIYQIIIDSIDG
jgi:dTDP-4-amino-4,6-dideoxygalactose transaminase